MRLNDLDTLPLLTPADMRRTEERAFALGVPAAVLMEHAAMAVVDVLQRLLAGECRGKRVLFLCGTGNNGGDGVAAARLFCQRGGEAEIWLSGEPQTALALAQLHWAQAAVQSQNPKMPLPYSRQHLSFHQVLKRKSRQKKTMCRLQHLLRKRPRRRIMFRQNINRH